MVYWYEKISSELVELSSEQRLQIIKILSERKARLVDINKELDSTKSEIHRNLSRLSKSKIISKDENGYFYLTPIGSIILSQIPFWTFLNDYKNFLASHSLGNLSEKFIQRMGCLEKCENIQGFVKIQKCWKNIYANAEKYIYNILYEIPYDDEILELLKNKIKKNVKLKNIFSIPVIISEDRNEKLKKSGFQKFLKKETIERKIIKNTSVLVVLNEKEACVHFPNITGEIDVSQALYGKDSNFREWCLDYFLECWQKSSPFREELINRE